MSERCEVCGPNKQESPTLMCAPCALSIRRIHMEVDAVVRVYKAQPVAKIAVPDLCILASETWPSPATGDPGWLRMSGERHDAEAGDIEAALHASLPGGTYDRILTKMLQRKASHFAVAHDAVFNSSDKDE